MRGEWKVEYGVILSIKRDYHPNLVLKGSSNMQDILVNAEADKYILNFQLINQKNPQ